MTQLSSELLNKKRVLLFDFDGTVFDTAKLKEQISIQLHEYTTNTDLLWETEKKLRDRRFHLAEAIREFCDKLGIESANHTIQEIFLSQNYPAFIFPDVIEKLKALHDQNILALFTEGDETYQQVKIQQSYLAQLFDFIYIYYRKIQHLDEIVTFFEGKEIWFIDNHLRHLQGAVQRQPQIKTVWVNREHLEPDMSFTPNLTITNLDQLVFDEQ